MFIFTHLSVFFQIRNLSSFIVSTVCNFYISTGNIGLNLFQISELSTAINHMCYIIFDSVITIPFVVIFLFRK